MVDFPVYKKLAFIKFSCFGSIGNSDIIRLLKLQLTSYTNKDQFVDDELPMEDGVQTANSVQLGGLHEKSPETQKFKCQVVGYVDHLVCTYITEADSPLMIY